MQLLSAHDFSRIIHSLAAIKLLVARHMYQYVYNFGEYSVSDDTKINFDRPEKSRWRVVDVVTHLSTKLDVRVLLIGGSSEWPPENVGRREVGAKGVGRTICT
jgi:hypothetical protein